MSYIGVSLAVSNSRPIFSGSGLVEVVMKVWAAGGGGANWNTYSSPAGDGGSGAFVTTTLLVPATLTSLLIRVGAGGISPGDGNPENNSGDVYYRGGSGNQGTSGWGGGQGGGYSGVFIGSRTISNALVVAGAGGGGGAGTTNTQGGSGGGPNGENGQGLYYGRGGTQSAGGAAGGGGATAGSALAGGNADTSANRGAGGGGAGYYGGGGSDSSDSSPEGSGSGGGGSSYYLPSTSVVDGSNITFVSGSYTVTTTSTAPNTGDTDYVSGVAAGGEAKAPGVTGGTGGAGLIVVYVDGTKYTYSTPGNHTLSL